MQKEAVSRKIREEDKGRKLWAKIRRYRFIYLMMIPVLIYFLAFSYYPMFLGIYNSFRKILMLRGSVFCGLANYQEVLSSPVYSQAFVNTLIVGAGTFALQFVWGMALAILLNEIRSKGVRSMFQTVSYIPHLLSWAVVGSVWITLLSPNGLINGILKAINGENFRKIVFMSERDYARGIMIFTGAWKGAGYYAALFLAAEKGAPAKDKRNYFLVFLLLLFSYMINGWLGYLCSALAWPALLLVEYQHGKPIQRQLQLVGISEALHLLFLLLTVYGGVSAMSFWTNILWVLLACARGWAALALYKGQEETV